MNRAIKQGAESAGNTESKSDNSDRSRQHLAGVPIALSVEKPRLSLRPQVTQLAALGKIDQLEALLESGADADSTSPNGCSALVIAAKYGQLRAVSILLQHGAKTHSEALAAAQVAGLHEIVECLMMVAE